MPGFQPQEHWHFKKSAKSLLQMAAVYFLGCLAHYSASPLKGLFPKGEWPLSE